MGALQHGEIERRWRVIYQENSDAVFFAVAIWLRNIGEVEILSRQRVPKAVREATTWVFWVVECILEKVWPNLTPLPETLSVTKQQYRPTPYHVSVVHSLVFHMSPVWVVLGRIWFKLSYTVWHCGCVWCLTQLRFLFSNPFSLSSTPRDSKIKAMRPSFHISALFALSLQCVFQRCDNTFYQRVFDHFHSEM